MRGKFRHKWSGGGEEGGDTKIESYLVRYMGLSWV